MAIVLGNKVREVAAIDSAIRDHGEIQGSFSKDEVDDLSLMLRTGALPASIDYARDADRGPSLGAASIRQGVMAAVAGMLAVMVFMLIYYRGAGINADLALLLNLVILLGFMGFVRGDADAAGHCGRHPDDRYGRGLERADLRARFAKSCARARRPRPRCSRALAHAW